MVPPIGVLLRPGPGNRGLILNFPFESVVECEHFWKFDCLSSGSSVTFVPLRVLVSIVVPGDSFSADFTEVQAVLPATRVRVVVRFPDGDIDNISAFDILPVCDGRVGRHPSPMVLPP